MKDFKDLEVFVQARLLVKDVYRMTSTFPKEEVYGITNQIRRSAVSILSNIAEGMGRQHKADTVQFLFVSRGSLYELEAQILISFDLGYITENNHELLNRQIQTCRKLLQGFINYIKESDHVKYSR